MTNNRKSGRRSVPRQTWAVTPEWKMAVREALASKGWNQTDLANAIGVSHVSISNLLSDGSSSPASKHVPAINLALGFQPPRSDVLLTPTQAKLLELVLDRLAPDASEKMLAMAELLPKKP